jgi:2-haloacid dehalogenase
MPLPLNIRALTIDVFGTVVEYRSTVTHGLFSAARTALNSATSSIPSGVRLRATPMSLEDWGRFMQEWRKAYTEYTWSRAKDPDLPVITIDEHHLDSLQTLLKAWSLDGLWDADQVQAVSLIWHKLVPWADSNPGLEALSSRFKTCTLSNGNLSLLEDLKEFGELSFTHVFSAEEFGTFKPNKAVYLGAAQKLKIPPSQCAMVAAHLSDLKAAKDCGFSTVYIERPQEEGWSKEKVQQAKVEGWVDIWVSEEEDGFVALDRKLKEQDQM